jgi:hypothetical protein
MSWWLIIIVIVAGIGAGFLISTLILRRQNNTYAEMPSQGTFTPHVEKPQPSVSKPAILTIEPREPKPIEKRPRPVILAEDTLEKFVSQAKSPQTTVPPISPARSVPPAFAKITPQAASPKITPQPTPVSAAIIELEANLSIAIQPSVNKLANFQTDIWNTRRSDFNQVSSQLLSELTEAYVDMLLANNIVWLVNELGRDSQDLRASYSELKIKVAERLRRVLPQIQDSFK